ncbi:uncharacterized protein LOC122320680 [Drosophila ficusphila]|uniref:uncharacterized protein LOC122320680 n=1 Tax=Drosophila ficusphila TaxID=30025 RepID=UPI001C8ACE82|nr:uncharacterized protein LOC122320680 [Drosophila ficusphila]
MAFGFRTPKVVQQFGAAARDHCRSNAGIQAEVLQGEGSANTYEKAGTGSVINITFMSPTLTRTSAWQVSDIYTGSDHRAITMEIRDGRFKRKNTNVSTGFRVSTLDPQALISMMKGLAYDERKNANENAICIKKATNGGNGCPPVYWWTDAIAKARRKYHQARRQYMRSRGRPNFASLQRLYKSLRSALKKKISASKKQCFAKLCDDANARPWGTAYKLVMGKLAAFSQPTPTCPEQLSNIVAHLFPPSVALQPQQEPSPLQSVNISKFKNAAEVLAEVKRIKVEKAPGPDMIPNKALKIIMTERLEIFVRLFNACFAQRTFPEAWKMRGLVLLPKGNQNDNLAAYRPLCILNTVAKIYERLICNRIEVALSEGPGLSQYDAIGLVHKLASEAIQGARWRGGSKKYCLVPSYLVDIVSEYLSNRQLLTILRRAVEAMQFQQVFLRARSWVLPSGTACTTEYSTYSSLKELRSLASQTILLSSQ